MGVEEDAGARMLAAPSEIELPRISVVTPSLNQREYLAATMESVLSQGYPQLEYIVIDGGSIDGSVQSIAARESDLTFWVSEADGGHAAAINKGFERSSGEIMAWLNSSDIYYPWTLHVVGEVFASFPQIRWIVGMPSFLGCDGRPRRMCVSQTTTWSLLSGLPGHVQQESVFWRRNVWDAAGGSLDEHFSLAFDHDLWLRFSKCTRLFHVDALLAGYRLHEDARSTLHSSEYAEECARALSHRTALMTRSTRSALLALRLSTAILGTGSVRRLLASRANPLGRDPHVCFDETQMSWLLRP